MGIQWQNVTFPPALLKTIDDELKVRGFLTLYFFPLWTLFQRKMTLFGTKGKEILKREFISTVLFHVCKLFNNARISVERDLEGKELGGNVDYELKVRNVLICCSALILLPGCARRS